MRKISQVILLCLTIVSNDIYATVCQFMRRDVELGFYFRWNSFSCHYRHLFLPCWYSSMFLHSRKKETSCHLNLIINSLCYLVFPSEICCITLWRICSLKLFCTWRREEALPIFKRRLLGGLLDFAARELQVQVNLTFYIFMLLLWWFIYIFVSHCMKYCGWTSQTNILRNKCPSVSRIFWRFLKNPRVIEYVLKRAGGRMTKL